MTAPETDVIDALAGIGPSSPLQAIRAHRAVARREAEASYRALFAPEEPGAASLVERFAVGTFVCGLHAEPAATAFYRAGLLRAGAAAGLAEAVDAAIAAMAGQGPYGRFPAGRLSVEDRPGPATVLPAALAEALGPRLAAALTHAGMLVFHPRDAAPADLQALLDAGWTTTGIVTLAQIVAFLSFQLRVVRGFRALAGTL